MRARLPESYDDLILNSPGLVLYVPCSDSDNVAREVKGWTNGAFSGTVGRLAPSPMLRDQRPGFKFTGVSGSKVVGTATTLPYLAADNASWMIWAYLTPSVTGDQSNFCGFGTTALTPVNGGVRGIIRFPSKVCLWGQNQDIQGSADYDLNLPQCIVCTKSGSTTATLYRNGVQLGTSSAKSYIDCATQDWWIALKHGLTSELSNTVVAKYAVWNRTLPPAEARHYYTEGMC